MPAEARKLLSFSDNRQDASLQAGHFNDFVQVSVVRATILQAVTGWDVDKEELIQTAHRGITLARLFNMREGFTRSDDRLPQRFYEDLPKLPGLTDVTKPVRLGPKRASKIRKLFVCWLAYHQPALAP